MPLDSVRVADVIAHAPSFFAAWEEVDSLWRQTIQPDRNLVPMSRAVLELRDSVRTELLKVTKR